MARICRVLGISRACAYRTSAGRPARYATADDRVVTAQIRTVIRTRSSYGARRVHALVNRAFATGYNVKRIQRVMELNGWQLPRGAGRDAVSWLPHAVPFHARRDPVAEAVRLLGGESVRPLVEEEPMLLDLERAVPAEPISNVASVEYPFVGIPR